MQRGNGLLGAALAITFAGLAQSAFAQTGEIKMAHLYIARHLRRGKLCFREGSTRDDHTVAGTSQRCSGRFTDAAVAASYDDLHIVDSSLRMASRTGDLIS